MNDEAIPRLASDSSGLRTETALIGDGCVEVLSSLKGCDFLDECGAHDSLPWSVGNSEDLAQVDELHTGRSDRLIRRVPTEPQPKPLQFTCQFLMHVSLLSAVDAF